MTTPVRPSRRAVVRGAAWTAPAVAIAAGVPPAYASSPNGQLVLLLGDTTVSTSHLSNYAVFLTNASVTVSGKAIPANQLSFTIDFVPDSGATAHRLYLNDTIRNWPTTQSLNTPLTSLLFTYQPSAGVGSTVALSESTSGTYLCQLDGSSTDTLGYLRFTVSAPGFTSAIVTRRVPPPAPALQITGTPSPLTVSGVLPHRKYGIYLTGFTVTPQNAGPAAQQLSLHCLFKPASNFNSSLFSVTPGNAGLVDWPAQQPASQPTSDASWLKVTPSQADQPITLNETLQGVPLVTITGTEATQQGTFVVRAQAPGFTTAQYESPAFPPPPGKLVFDPGGSLIRQDPNTGVWGLRFSGASLTLPEAVEGGYVTMTVTYAPTVGPDTLQYGSVAPAGWAAPSGVTPGTTARTLTYVLQTQQSGKVAIQDGMFFSQSLAPSAQQGTMTVTFSCPQLTSDQRGFGVTPTAYLEVLNPSVIQLKPVGNTWELSFSRHTLQAAGAAAPAANKVTLMVERVNYVSGYPYQTFVRSIDNWTPQVTTPEVFFSKTFTYPGAATTWSPSPSGQSSTLAIGTAAAATYVTGQLGTTGAIRMTYAAGGFVSAVVERPLP